ncbi:hypothetical protein Peur_018722 [Populus x canadensis]
MSSLLSPDAIAVFGAIVNCPKRHINGFKNINSWARALVKDSAPNRSVNFPAVTERGMRPTQVDFFADMEEQGSTVAMDVDDVDTLEMFGEGVINMENKLADADFFNYFEDDFEDSDIN